jgi:hypothetical protein
MKKEISQQDIEQRLFDALVSQDTETQEALVLLLNTCYNSPGLIVRFFEGKKGITYTTEKKPKIGFNTRKE